MPAATTANRFERGLLAALQRLPALQGQRLLVAASGGADSTALLAALHELARTGRFPCELFACHVDHGLRPAPARQAEQALLAETCAALEVPLIVRPVRVERRRSGSPEAAARTARYAALGAVAAERQASAVLTAHTAGDQAETVLLRLLRGTGPMGLAGISAQSRPWGAAAALLARPLLAAWPEATRGYCRSRNVAWSEDETNASPRFTRNRVRHELLSLMTALNPGAGRSLARLAGQAAELRDWIDGEIEQIVSACLVREGDALLLRPAPAGLAPFLGKQLAARVLGELLGGAGAPGARQVEALFACWAGSLGRRSDLGGGWQAEATSAGLRLRRVTASNRVIREAGGAASTASDHWSLQLGLTEIPGWQVRVVRGASADLPAAGPELTAYISGTSGHSIDPLAQLSIRFWRPGDRMRPAGMGGRKKLQDIFVDEKVDRAQRHSVPLLLLDGECIWAVGVKRSALASATPHVRAALRVSFVARDEE